MMTNAVDMASSLAFVEYKRIHKKFKKTYKNIKRSVAEKTYRSGSAYKALNAKNFPTNIPFTKAPLALSGHKNRFVG